MNTAQLIRNKVTNGYWDGTPAPMSFMATRETAKPLTPSEAAVIRATYANTELEAAESHQTPPMKPRLIHRHRSESTYAYGDYRITVRRRSEGCYPHKRRTWNEVCVTHARFPGSDWGFNSLKGAVEAINKGSTSVTA